MQLLREYYEALGAIITRYEVTLTSFSADGLMILVNAPVPCEEPALHAVKMAIDMQEAIQGLSGWRHRGYQIGFGMGLAMGWATVGRIGYEARVDYTAIGNVVNLASRLCSSADDRQILIDHSVARHLRDKIPIVDLALANLKVSTGTLASTMSIRKALGPLAPNAMNFPRKGRQAGYRAVALGVPQSAQAGE